MSPVDRSRLPEVGPEAPFTFPVIRIRRLDNGLAVRTAQHRGVPVITFVLQVPAGSGCDPSEQGGLAGIAADMLDEGTGRLSAIDIAEALAGIGADVAMDVGPDVATLSLTTLTRFADRGAELLASLATRPSLQDEDFQRARQLRLDRLRQHRDVPLVVAERAFLRLLYRDHPYGHLAIGNERALRAMRIEDVRRFHSQVYRPDGATLIVVGAESDDDLVRIAERAFGQWRPPAGPAPDRPPNVAPAAAPRLALMRRDGAQQSYLRIGQLSARRDTPDYPALVVMNAVLGGQFVSRINLKLREEKGYTYGARTGFDWRRGLSPFALDVAVDSAATVDAVRDALHELTAIRGDRPATPEEMVLARASLTRGFPRNFETAQQVARGVAQLALYDLPDTYFEEFVPRVNAVALDDVTRVASSYLQPDRLTTLIVGDPDVIAEPLGSLQLGEPMILSLEE